MKQAVRYIHISITHQQLHLMYADKRIISYPVSTAKNGAGENMDSECTPTGWHKIRAKIGKLQPINTVFVKRRATAEIYDNALKNQFPQRDWILTRILWIAGLEPGKNRYGQVDSSWRYIYIHGCPDELINGKPQSHGCIRMKNADVLDLYGRVQVGLKVWIR